MRPILTREQMRAYDAYAIERCHVPGVVLMENAGRSAAEIIEEAMQDPLGVIVIVCGTGNNGGDGFVVARHLAASRVNVQVFLVGDPDRIKGDARLNLDALQGLGLELRCVREDEDLPALIGALGGAELVVDAMFGTGLARPIEGRWVEVIAAVNDCHHPCVALDIPSGIDADSGAVLGVAVCAQHTITFGHFKTGLLQGAALNHTGEVQVVGLGICDEHILAEVGPAAELIDNHQLTLALGERPADTHKYRSGSVLLIAGSLGKTGAALLSANASLRAGAGVATIASWPEALAVLAPQLQEVMSTALDRNELEPSVQLALQKRSAVGIGPGLGRDEDARKLCETVVIDWKGPVVVDADAISHFAGRASLLLEAKGPRVLTPHTGELARLLDCSISDIEADRFGTAARAAAETGCVVLLKGPHTVVATPMGDCRVSEHANPLLATAGSGDVLTGIVAAFLCTAPDAASAAAGATQAHSLTAALFSEQHPGADRGMIASDMIALLPQVLGSCS